MRLRIGFSFGVAKKRRAITHCVAMPFRWVASGVVASARWVGALPGRAWRKVVAGFRATLRSPASAYRSFKSGRDWLLAKIEFLQSESEKWRRTFMVLKSPYTFLRACGLNPSMAMSVLFAGSVAGTGAVAAEVMQSPSFNRGDSGVYLAPSDSPTFYEQEFNTLRVDLSAVPIGSITVEDTTLGTAYADSALPQGETAPIIIGGKAGTTDPLFLETFLETSHLIIDRWRCESLSITNSEANQLIIVGVVSDGQSISPIPGTPRMRAVNGGNRAADMHSHSSYFDQLRIQAVSSGVNAKVDVLTLSNLYSRGGACLIDRVKADIIELRYLEIGGDEDLSTKEFVVANTVVYTALLAQGNTEEEMANPAIQ